MTNPTLTKRLADVYLFLRIVDQQRERANDPTLATIAESRIMARELAELERVSYQTEVETQ